ncbi:hypothetical protein S40285_09576 [Stachybotrys chlorohalonatus IBT 40285]|uniref:Uncharacterized protein n=1 Tax=Stachybotrys chlorohalonatus (strain IBT 40285) TaxID=1283841 RepID=A0A084QPV0_STAC4|nr:hypothetical protein S40285_09576 [Stachybotrys chlorohalonata IBT 40285]
MAREGLEPYVTDLYGRL